jgi:23S rRNA (cytidine1920-2'-O)/16S rRNA (cytidine1409-2'-O)-methyltransferase
VVVHDAVNVRSLTPDLMRELIQFVTIDLSFISLSKVLPALTAFAPTEVLALVKPQFEAAREEVEAGGLIRSPELRLEILERVKRIAVAHDFVALGETPSPIPGQKGNREFFLWWRVDSKPPQPD